MKKLLPVIFLLAACAFGQHSVSLTWTASATQDVTGYNVYRGTTSGGPYQQLNVFRITALTYTDASVQPGVTYYYVATAVNATGESIYSNQATAVIPPAPVITCGTAPTSGMVGQVYTNTLAPSSGVPPYVISISAGALPDGLSFNTTSGALSGTPTQSGAFSFTANVADSSNTTGSAACSITIIPALSVSCNNPPSGVVGTAYTHTFTSAGGTSPYTFAISAGSLPTGLTLASNGGVSGTPTASGTFSYTVRTTDAASRTATAACGITIAAAPVPVTVSCNTPPSGIVGTAYTHTFTASGGTSPYTFAISAGTLPAGLALNSSGVLSGTPTISGTFTYTVRARDTLAATGTASCGITIAPAPVPVTVSCSNPPDGIVGTAYSHTFPAAGGTSPYTFVITAGALPDGVTLASDGSATGTPTVDGTFSYTVQATDTLSVAGSSACSTTIQPSGTPLSASCNNPPAGVVGTAYTHVSAASGGTSPYTFSVSAGALPGGLTLGSGGGITGTPTTDGVFSYTLEATDAAMGTATASCGITITAAPIPVTADCNTPPAGVVGTAYTHGFTATGGTSPYTYAFSSGSLPGGLTISSSGTLAGTPTTVGTFAYTIRATDSLSATDTAACSTTITAAPIPVTLSCGVPPGGIVGSGYTYSFSAAGGTAPYTYAIAAGSLPSGLTLGTDGSFTGAPAAAGTFSYTVGATDGLSATGSAACSLTVVQPLTISCNGPAAGIVGQPYSYTFPVSGGTAPYSSSIVGGQLPSGLTWNGSTSTLAGTFSAAGSYIYSIRVGDSGSLTQSVTCGTSISVLLPYIPPRTTIPQTVLVRPIGPNELVLPLASLNGLLPFSPDLRTRTFGAFIDKEWMVMTHPPTIADLQAVGSTVLLQVFRGAFGGRPANHRTGSVVWYGPTEYFKTGHPPRACDTSLEVIVPWIDISGGGIYDCTNGRWVKR